MYLFLTFLNLLLKKLNIFIVHNNKIIKQCFIRQVALEFSSLAHFYCSFMNDHEFDP